MMSSHVRGEPKKTYQTSMSFTFYAGDPPTTAPGLHKLVDFTCDSCSAQGIAFDKRTPVGWEYREVLPKVRGGWPRYYDLCPACSKKPDAEIDGRY